MCIVAHRVQEQENQKRQLCEELEQLKTPQDSREASCQTPALEEEVREEGRKGGLPHDFHACASALMFSYHNIRVL